MDRGSAKMVRIFWMQRETSDLLIWFPLPAASTANGNILIPKIHLQNSQGGVKASPFQNASTVLIRMWVSSDGFQQDYQHLFLPFE